MPRNEAVRSQLRVMMADGAGGGETDALVNSVITLVLETLGVHSPELGEVRSTVDLRDRPGSSRELAAVRAATVVERLEPLIAVAEAGQRYRRAVAKGKGAKKARKKLFDALETWKESQAAPSR